MRLSSSRNQEKVKNSERGKKLILAQLSVYPICEGTSLSRFVKKGMKIIKESGFTYEIGGLSTAIEVPDLDSLFLLVKKVHQAHLDEGAKRIVIERIMFHFIFFKETRQYL